MPEMNDPKYTVLEYKDLNAVYAAILQLILVSGGGADNYALEDGGNLSSINSRLLSILNNTSNTNNAVRGNDGYSAIYGAYNINDGGTIIVPSTFDGRNFIVQLQVLAGTGMAFETSMDNVTFHPFPFVRHSDSALVSVLSESGMYTATQIIGVPYMRMRSLQAGNLNYVQYRSMNYGL